MTIDSGTKFIVFTSQRSGSSWLISILTKLENTTAYGELFLRRKRVPGDQKWDSNFAYPRFLETEPNGLIIRPFSTCSYLNGVYRKPGAIGFKLMYWHLRLYPEILAYLVRHHIRVVHLVRQNHLNVVISGAIRAKTGRAHPLSGQPELDDMRIELNPETLISRLNKLQRNILIARRLLRWCRLPHIEVAYEDLLRDQSGFNLIWNFLSINPEEHMPQSNLIKIRKGRHSDVISNYDEVKEALASSEFAELIEEKRLDGENDH